MISVIVPVYNVEKYLPKCIESIINQTYSNLEIILVDDGSTDNSGIICDEYASLDRRISVIHNRNRGVSYARNTGLDNAKGDYIAFVDSDDYIEKDMYKKMIDIFLTKNVDIVSCNYNHVDEYDRKTPFFCLNDDEYIDDKNYLLEQVFKYKNYDMIIFNKLYKKEIWDKVRFPININLAEDLMTLYPTIHIANKFYCLKDALYNKFQRKEGLTNSIKVEDYINNIKAYENFLDLVSNDKSLDYERIFSLCVNILFRHYKHLLDIIYIKGNMYNDLEKKCVDSILSLSNNNSLERNNKIKILLLKISPAIYRLYRTISYKWKAYK